MYYRYTPLPRLELLGSTIKHIGLSGIRLKPRASRPACLYEELDCITQRLVLLVSKNKPAPVEGAQRLELLGSTTKHIGLSGIRLKPRASRPACLYEELTAFGIIYIRK